MSIAQALMVAVETGDPHEIKYQSSRVYAEAAFGTLNCPDDNHVPVFKETDRNVLSLYAAFVLAALQDL